MTTLGKILVFFVFVAALAMGGLMVFLAKTTPNWKTAVDQRNEYIEAMQAINSEEAKSRQKLIAEIERMKRLLENNNTDKNSAVERLKQDVDAKEKQLQEALTQMRKSDDLLKKNQTEVVRLQNEVKFLSDVVAEREKTIVKAQQDVAKADNDKQAALNNVVTLKNLVSNMQARITELERKVVAEAAPVVAKGPAGPVATAPKDASYTNPPAAYVKGQIERVDETDKTLVKITVGSDAGLRKDNTLEVYRLGPNPAYLGRLVIVDADLRHAIGRLLRQPGVPTPALQPGDEVASKLRP